MARARALLRIGMPRAAADSIAGLFCKRRVFRSTRANARRCNGYRCTKRHGKPVFTNRHLSLQDRHFCDSMSACPPRAFTPRSSRYLNCPSNLIGHDQSNKPANGVGNNGTF
jgi:hypothetical protein